MKKFIAVLSAALLLSAFAVSVSAQKASPAEWAADSFDKMTAIGAIPEDILTQNYGQSIKRRDFAQLIHYSYNAFTGISFEAEEEHHFSDMLVPDKSISAMYELGIMQGDENNEFHPDDNITRQETAVVITNFYAVLNGYSLSDDTSVLHNFNDCEKIAFWAQRYAAGVVNAGYMGDYGDNEFHPWDNVTIEQAVSMVSRMGDAPDANLKDTEAEEKKELSGTLSAKYAESDGYISVSWDEITNADEYTVTVTEQRNHIRSDDIDPRTTTYTTSGTDIQIPSAPERSYIITVSAGNISENLEFTSQPVYNDTTDFNLPETQEEAEPLMREIEINVWKINDSGEKYASTASLKVHTDIADIVYDIFQEIFEGDEQFPIQSVGGYAWRGGRSEHNWGTAIDINPTQNYCIYTSGEIVGDYWKPYDDPYSITPYGDVMNAFENHGFTWGGDAWSGNVDYMHFSYFGT